MSTVRTRSWQIYAVSADSPTELEREAARTADALAEGARVPGPGSGRHRLAVVAAEPSEAAELLRNPSAATVSSGEVAGEDVCAVFLYPGVGEQKRGVAREPYRALDTFRATIDECADRLAPRLGVDLREHLLACEEQNPDPLHQTRLAQPAIFCLEIAVAAQLRAWGLEPTALVGYSIGEYAAATTAGVMRLPDALDLVARRAGLIDELPEGAMMLVLLGPDEVVPYLTGGVCLAAVNGQKLSVVSGPSGEISALAARCAREGIVTMGLPSRHAFHSTMMHPLDRPMRTALSTVELSPQRIPFTSNVTGDWTTPAEAQDPAYWSRHLRQTVRFTDNLSRVWELPNPLTVEVGPGQMLTSLANQHPERVARTDVTTLAPMSRLSNRRGTAAALVGVVAAAWTRGLPVDPAQVSVEAL